MAESIRVLIHTEHPFKFWCFPEEGLRRLKETFPDVEFILVRNPEEVPREIEDAVVFFGWRFDPAWLKRAGKLKWIHSPAAGVRRLMHPELVRHPVIITNARGMHATVIAEHVMAIMVMFSRQFLQCYRFQQERYWGNHALIESPTGLVEVSGRTVLIVGYGSIGQAIGKRAVAFDMHVHAIRRHPEKPSPWAERVGGIDDLKAMLPLADFVVLSAPHTDETKGWFDEEKFRWMKSTAYFINVARGHLVDEEALVKALETGQIAGAALDVFQEEPLPPESPLWGAPNLFITPHVAGVVTDRHWDRVIEGFSENLKRFLRGEPLMNVVDKSLGY